MSPTAPVSAPKRSPPYGMPSLAVPTTESPTLVHWWTNWYRSSAFSI